MYSKAVTKILSSRIYAISRQEIGLGSSFDSTFILFLITDAFDKHLRIKINDKNFE